ncbi:MAG TPA: hypothetical protein VGN75_18760 [Kaistia sp.]|nr:hypothetical protein [Kaistia sp.]
MSRRPGYFTKLTGLFKNLNYAASGSPHAEGFVQEIEALVAAAPMFRAA